MRLSVAAGVGGSILVAVALLLVPYADAQGQNVGVVLELGQQFYYEGDVLSLQISVRSAGTSKVPNPVRTPLFEGFKVRTPGGELLEPVGKSGRPEPDRPDELSPGSFYGAVLDIGELYPQLRKAGTYEIYWGGSGLVSEMLVVNVIPRYEPSKDYIGKIVTDQGTIVIDFFQEQSPIAVKSVIDMAHAGFFNGLQIHEVHRDAFIVGGDPVFADRPRRTISFPAELTSLPLVAGTVVLKPVSAAPPANGSTFMILLKPQPEWTGQVTVLGQVIQGLDVVRKISQARSSMRNSRPFFKPLEEIGIRKFSITEKTDGGSPSSS